MDAVTHFLQGGAFLLKDEAPDSVFTPEDFTEEHLLLQRSLRDFLQQKVESRREAFDSEEGYALAPGLLEEMGELGFLGIGVPEEYGGYEADFRTQLVFGEVAYSAWAFGLSIGVQTSLGVAPLLLYGNEAQRARYLPGIVSAQIKSCYCLTEPGAGSDANSGKTKATPSADGRFFLLNGQKMWITSSGHADLFFVFCKIEEDANLSCLIVERDFGGIRLGAEEKKMGIKGSSTRQVFFEDVQVPVENLLGERNGGFKIALNVLNTGRIKMATSVTGNAKRALRLGVQYALERRQFDRPIAQFGAIQHKIGEMTSRLYAMESMAYRIGGHIDQAWNRLTEQGMDGLEAKWRSIAEYAMECAMAKVHNTEGEDFIVDEVLQIHGGMGFSAETDIETLYRNVRVNRIYEGTNEINRLLAVDQFLRRALRGELQLLPALKQAMLEAAQTPETPFVTGLSLERQGLRQLKQSLLLLIGAAQQSLAGTLAEEQEILMQLADGLIQLYALESALLRSEKSEEQGEANLRRDLNLILMHRAADQIRLAGKEILQALGESPALALWRAALERWTSLPPANLRDARRRVATAVLERGEYPFNPA